MVGVLDSIFKVPEYKSQSCGCFTDYCYIVGNKQNRSVPYIITLAFKIYFI